MKMKLKGNKTKKSFFKKIKDLINYRSFLIFFICLFIISILFGILFFVLLKSDDKSLVISKVKDYFSIGSSYNYLGLLKNELFSNIFNVFIIWILGISAIGIIVLLLLFFAEGFSVGFTISAIIYTFKYKGILAAFLYLFPSQILYIIIFILICFIACKFSYKLISFIFLKKEIDFRSLFKRYVKVFIITFIFSILYSLLIVFLNPFLIKFFTFFIK